MLLGIVFLYFVLELVDQELKLEVFNCCNHNACGQIVTKDKPAA